MTTIPQAAIDAVAEALLAAGLLNNAGYIEGDEYRAAELALAAAERAWPHDAPRRDPASTVAGTATIRAQPEHPQQARLQAGIGFTGNPVHLLDSEEPHA